MPILALNDIYKRFGTHVALHNVSLTVEAGQVVAIIGRSGSGKTTLLRCINGLEIPDSGEIVFDGRRVEPSRTGLRALRREIGIVFQSFNLFPHLSVERNITLGPTVGLGLPLAEAKRRAREVLSQVDLEDKIAAVPLQLSGGQQQRVAIARSLDCLHAPGSSLGDRTPFSTIYRARYGRVGQLHRCRSSGELGRARVAARLLRP